MIILTILKTLLNDLFQLIKAHWSFIKTYWKQALMILGLLFIFNGMKGCYHKIMPSKPISSPSVSNLPKGDREIIRVDSTRGTTDITNEKGTTTVTGTRGATVEIKKDGTVKVTEKTIGFCHNIMLGAAINNTGPKGTIGLEWFFYKRLDLISGFGADKYLSHTAGFTSVGYTPVNKIFHGNTSFWLGGSLDTTGTKSVMIGFSVRI